MNKNKMRQVRKNLAYLCGELKVCALKVRSTGGFEVTVKHTDDGYTHRFSFNNMWPGAASGLFRANDVSRNERKKQIEAKKKEGWKFSPNPGFAKPILDHRNDWANRPV